MSEPFPEMPKQGDRIEYHFTKVFTDGLQSGDQGRVLSADAYGTINVKWDDGRTFKVARAWHFYSILPGEALNEAPNEVLNDCA